MFDVIGEAFFKWGSGTTVRNESFQLVIRDAGWKIEAHFFYKADRRRVSETLLCVQPANIIVAPQLITPGIASGCNRHRNRYRK